MIVLSLQTLEAVPPVPTTNARLAAAVALFIKAEDELTASRQADGYVPLRKFAARREAFANLKTIFELEFPQ